MADNQDNKNRFLKICQDVIQRPGMDKLLAWLEKSDFFTAPASRNHHLAYAGGLLEHSLNVYDELRRLCGAYSGFATVSEESIAIMALFHDLCKVNFYKPDTRNVKKDGVWVTVPSYSIDEKFVYGGHGSKSVFIASRFIELTPEEAVAINCHMASWDGNKDVGNAFKACPAAWLLHVADEAATFLVEREEA